MKKILIISCCILLLGCGRTPELVKEEPVQVEKSERVDECKPGREIEKLENSTESYTPRQELYDSYLKGELTVELGGESIDINAKGNEVEYIEMDIDGDGEEELCVRAFPSFYILKAQAGELTVIYSGATYDEPINNEDMVGVYWYRPGAAPTHDDYKFVSFKNGSVDKENYYSWYDENDNMKMDKTDKYIVIRNDERSEMDMKKWLNMAQIYVDNQDYHADWIDLK
ncbi:hypothetical protein [Pseudobutyrivibrio sp. MD2005]|uniref:hypothetical protein n=1 Tax=Pseudobutyrivibrio sp. MD2005 TaxID=1410616 RepID=UPI000489748E|nr:hypothetical protein [Pseudobutyrivibrio sp. MD2005]